MIPVNMSSALLPRPRSSTAAPQPVLELLVTRVHSYFRVSGTTKHNRSDALVDLVANRPVFVAGRARRADPDRGSFALRHLIVPVLPLPPPRLRLVPRVRASRSCARPPSCGRTSVLDRGRWRWRGQAAAG